MLSITDTMVVNTVSLTIIVIVHWGEAMSLFKEDPENENQKELVAYLCRERLIKSPEVSEVMNKVDRGHYVAETPYRDLPIKIGYGATISAPHMHGLALEELKGHLKPGNKVLDVGSGSGYLTVCMALMMGKTGHVVGLEKIPQLIDYAKNNVMKDYNELLTSGRVKFILGNGRLGVPEEGPFDAIHVGAAANKIPKALLRQLKKGGRILIPIGEFGIPQDMMVVDKDKDGKITKHSKGLVAYVPLTY